MSTYLRNLNFYGNTSFVKQEIFTEDFCCFALIS